MSRGVSRRNLFQTASAAAAAILSIRGAKAQNVNLAGEAKQRPRTVTPHPAGFDPYNQRAAVALVKGEDRRKNIFNALVAIDDQIKPKLKAKKYVLIKPNNVGTVNQLGNTHADAIRGILDYLEPRFKGPVVIGESSAGLTRQGFDNFKYPALVNEYKKLKLSLVDFNEEAKYVQMPLLDYHLHVVPARLAARLFDPDAFVISSALFKVHNIAVVTLSVKNMVLGAPLHQAPNEKENWSDKRRYHAGIRQSMYNIYLTAQRMQPYWGAAVVDGFEGIEGGFGVGATPLPHKVAVASTDFVAADRVTSAAMGVDPEWLGWLKYCGEAGVGQWDLSKIDIRGEQLAAVTQKYRLHPDIELQLQWRGPMEELPPTLGWTHPIKVDQFDA